MANSIQTLPAQSSLKPRQTSVWLALAGAAVGAVGYFYLTRTASGQRVVERTKNRLDNYLADIENRLAAAQYRAEYEESL